MHGHHMLPLCLLTAQLFLAVIVCTSMVLALILQVVQIIVPSVSPSACFAAVGCRSFDIYIFLLTSLIQYSVSGGGKHYIVHQDRVMDKLR